MFQLPPQIFINGLIAGSLYSVIAIGLALSYGILKFVNFAHAEMAMIGGYIFFGLQLAGVATILNIIVTILLVGLLGIIVEKTTFKPIKKINANGPLLASISLSFFIKGLVTLVAGTDVKTLDRSFIQSYSFFNDKIVITNLQIIIMIASVGLMAGLFAFLKYTKTGKAIRAVASNSQAAEIVGINKEKIIATVFFVASALAGAAGILIGYQNNLFTNMGSFLIVKAFAAIIIGGIGSIPAAIGGGYLIGMVENLAIGITIAGYSIPTGYKDVIAFIILIGVLLLRPKGLFIKYAREA
jgi:branched-chain amino acid transport system permease protein